MHAWLAGKPGVWPDEDTLAGASPGWLLRSRAEQRASDPCFAQFVPVADDECGTDDAPMDGLRTESLRLMLASPLGAYALSGGRIETLKSGLATQTLEEEMLHLSTSMEAGSVVAARMFETRMLWVEGEEALRSAGGADAAAMAHQERAVECFAASLRASVADGDPFHGWLTPRGADSSMATASTRYTACADAVLKRADHHVDAHLVRAWAFERSGRLADAEEVLTALIDRHAPEDAHGALYSRALMRGNSGRWHDNLVDMRRCVQLCPEEPMFHYWEGVALRNVMDSSNAAELGTQAIAAYRRFLDAAAPEGRKVCEAYYQLAALELLNRPDTRSTPPETALAERVIALVRAGQAAEAAKLPVFAETANEVKKWRFR